MKWTTHRKASLQGLFGFICGVFILVFVHLVEMKTGRIGDMTIINLVGGTAPFLLFIMLYMLARWG